MIRRVEKAINDERDAEEAFSARMRARRDQA
jgi:hypothetical protein